MGDPALKLTPEMNPVWRAVLAAPLSHEPETDEEREAIAAIQADIAAGRRGRSSEDVRALIEEMRHEQGE